MAEPQEPASTPTPLDINQQQGQPATGDPTPPAATEPTDWQAEAEKWKALSRKNETQAKANVDAAKQWNDFQESQKSETDKLKEHNAQLEAQLKEAQTTVLRSQYAAKNNIPVTLLTADTEDALEAQVKALLAFKTPQPPASSGIDTGAAARQSTTFTRQQISDPTFYHKHRDEILKAQQAGRILA
ncbi:MAG: hypothetical protein ABF780_05730 [Bifidobacterium aquikefiri]|uniref:Uncharacterized protein n=1 Tax=Bifidobacterium aquikefiri TaxID=1653207 RepID=A0A261G2C6_9BIFI|nr:hypothetical protein [Bifidobacterium aquikefiri]OZG65538.1 hypothetical protein BAQU_1721 [Bifidobacterium aquikefiri]